MATFVLLSTVEELLFPPGVDEDPTFRIWVFTKRNPLEVDAAFLNTGYNYLHSPVRPIYYLQAFCQPPRRTSAIRALLPLRLRDGRLQSCEHVHQLRELLPHAPLYPPAKVRGSAAGGPGAPANG